MKIFKIIFLVHFFCLVMNFELVATYPFKVEKGTVLDVRTRFIWQRSMSKNMNWNDAIEYCRNLDLGGFTDWMLPTRLELLSIIDYTKSPVFDDAVFEGINSNSSDCCWTSTAALVGYEIQVFQINHFGYSFSWPKEEGTNRAKCVRSKRTPNEHLEVGYIIKDTIVIDNKRSLIWQRFTPGKKTIQNGKVYCQDLSLEGYSDWQLPNIKQLATLVDATFFNTALDVQMFPIPDDDSLKKIYLSSTRLAGNSSELVWYIDFSLGYISHLLPKDKSDRFYFRCVRELN